MNHHLPNGGFDSTSSNSNNNSSNSSNVNEESIGYNIETTNISMGSYINPLHVIQGEIYGLLSHLKLNNRWNQYHSLIPENSILISLKNLSNTLHKESDFTTLDTCSYLDPFLSVIRSDEISGPITGTALTSVNKFLNLFINLNCNNVHKAIRNIAESASHCKFEATDSRSDEVVLMKILQVLLSCVKNSAGIYLSNDLIFEITQTCYLMTDQSRSSELLKKTAEMTIQEIVSIIYSRYNIYTKPPTPPPLPPQDTIQIDQIADTSNTNNNPNNEAVTTTNNLTQLISNNNNNENNNNNNDSTLTTPLDQLKLDDNSFSPNNDLFFSNLPTVPNEQPLPVPVPTPTPQTPTPTHTPLTGSNTLSPTNSTSSNTSTQKPSLPSSTITSPTSTPFSPNTQQRELKTSKLINIINDSDKSYDQTVLIRIFKYFVSNIGANVDAFDKEMTRLLCLNLINTILQARGTSLELIPEIMSIVQDELFRSLLMNLQSRSIPIFSLTMRIFFNMFVTLRRTLKSQYEEFFNVLLKSVIDVKINQDYNNRNMMELQELALEGLRDFCKLPLAMPNLYINYDCELYCGNLFESLCKILYKNSFPLSGPLNSLHILSLENLLSIIQSIDDRSSYPKYINHNQVANSNSLQLPYNLKREYKRIMSIAAENFNLRKPIEAYEYLLENSIIPELNSKTISKFLIDTPKLNKYKVGEYLGKKNEKMNNNVLSDYLDHFLSTSADYMVGYRNFLESFRIPGEAGVVQHIFEPLSQKIYKSLTDAGDNTFKDPDSVFLYLYSGLMIHTSTFNPNVMAKDRMKLNDVYIMLKPQGFSEEMVSKIFKEMTIELYVDEEHPNPGVITNQSWRNIIKRSKKVGDFESVLSNEYDKDIFPIILNLVIPAISKVFEKIESDSLSQRVLDGFHLCAQVSANYNINETIDNLMNTLCTNTTLIEKESSSNNANNNNSNSSNSNHINNNMDQYNNFFDNNKAQLATITTFEIAIKYSSHLNESWKNIIAIICKLHRLGLLTNIFEVIDFPIETKKPENKNTDKQKTNSLFKWFVSESEDIEEQQENKQEQKAKICVDNCNIKDLFIETKNIPILSLDYLLQSLYSLTIPKNNISWNQKQALFCLELITHIILINQDRLNAIWKPFYHHLETIIQSWDQSPKFIPFIEKTVLSMMYLLIRLLDRPEVSDSLTSLVKLILKVNALIESIAEKMSVALLQLVQSNIKFISTNQSVREPINGIIVILSGNPKSSLRACDALSSIIMSGDQTPKSSEDCLTTINCFINATSIPPTVTIRAMELLHHIFLNIGTTMHIPSDYYTKSQQLLSSPPPQSSRQSIAEKVKMRMIEQSITDAWEKFWSKILSTLCSLCLDPKPTIRNNAMNYLQKSILSDALLVLSPTKWLTCFVDIVFPLLAKLRDETNYEDTRLRASALLSKVFLQNLTIITQLPGFIKLWSEILLYLRQYMGLSEVLSESVPESLKNMLLVMNNSGVFKPPPLSFQQQQQQQQQIPPSQSNPIDPNNTNIPPPTSDDTTTTTSTPNMEGLTPQEQQSIQLWDMTWTTINEFCPKIKDDVLSRVQPQSQPTQPQQPVQQTIPQQPQQPNATPNELVQDST